MPRKKKRDHERKEAVYVPNPKCLDGISDLSMLSFLEMTNLLHNLEYRYCKMPRKYCYTSISTILIAINPYERLPIYGQDVINEFQEAMKRGQLHLERPHPYGVSARAYIRMIQNKCNQSVIICGESGAGKSETGKLLIRYLAMTAPSVSMESSNVEQQIIAISPILEAYGNAKTVINNNASRFSKFTKLLYDIPDKGTEGNLLGSYLETYLLEKSRVVFHAANERNYHIPYFLYHGVAKDKHEEFGIIHPENWIYANQGGVVEVPGINDSERYKELEESLKLMRIDDNMQQQLYSITTGIFNLGNISFKREGDGFVSIDMKRTQIFLENVAKLWGLEQKAVAARLTTKTMKIMRKVVVKKIPYDEAATNRDSIAKAIYENLFLYLCQHINAELYQIDDEHKKSLLFIGILDIFGFQNFWINSLEQFCMNFMNEKVQQLFNYCAIRREQEECMKEIPFWTPVNIPDNWEYIRLMEDKSDGFFTLLDHACKAPKPRTDVFMQNLFKTHKKSTCIKTIRKPGSGNARGHGWRKTRRRRKGKGNIFDGFEIKHFADDVGYDVSKFLIKNMEVIHVDTAKMMEKSKIGLVKVIGGVQSKTPQKKSVTAVFYDGIKSLMKNLQATEPRFIYCVNPNHLKSMTIWCEPVVEHQLRCGGLVETLKVLSMKHGIRLTFGYIHIVEKECFMNQKFVPNNLIDLIFLYMNLKMNVNAIVH